MGGFCAGVGKEEGGAGFGVGQALFLLRLPDRVPRVPW